MKWKESKIIVEKILPWRKQELIKILLSACKESMEEGFIEFLL